MPIKDTKLLQGKWNDLKKRKFLLWGSALNNVNGAVKICMSTSIRNAYTMVFRFLYNKIILV